MKTFSATTLKVSIYPADKKQPGDMRRHQCMLRAIFVAVYSALLGDTKMLDYINYVIQCTQLNWFIINTPNCIETNIHGFITNKKKEQK